MMIFVYIGLVCVGIYLTIRLLAPEWNKPVAVKPKKSKIPTVEAVRTPSKKIISIAQKSIIASSDVQAIQEYIERLETRENETVKNFEEIVTSIDAPSLQESFNTYRKSKDVRIAELTEKAQKLEKLLDERGKEFKKTEIDRGNEVRNREEFQKVRDLLEDQLMELKEKNKTLSQENIELKKQNESLKDQFSTKAIF